MIERARIYKEELSARAAELVVATRTSALSELENTGVLLDADAVWSMWPGYLRDESAEQSLRIFRRNGVLLHQIHTSGHASAEDICELVGRLGARQVVPIHTSSPRACALAYDRAVLQNDGEWWEA